MDMTTTDKQREAFVALRETIVPALTKAGAPGFSVAPNADESDDERCIKLTREDGYGLYLSLNWYQRPGKIHVSHIAPQDNAGRTLWWSEYMPRAAGSFERATAPEINVSADKTADQIARDIVRRMLPALAVGWPVVQGIMADRIAATSARDTALAAIREMGGVWHEGTPERPIGPADSVRVRFPMPDHRDLHATVSAGGHVQIPSFYPSLDVLRAVVTAMRAGKES